METALLALAFSLTAVIGGSIMLLAVALVVIPRLTARKPASSPGALARVEGPTDSVIIAQDYELEARPERSPAFETPVAMPSLESELGDEDSFEDLFDSAPALVHTYGNQHRAIDSTPRASRLSRQLQRVSAFAATGPLPIPVAPPGVEPIPELEPTQLIMRRPEWALDWP